MTTVEGLETSPQARSIGRVAVAINAKAGAARASDHGLLKQQIRDAVGAIGEVVDITFVEPRAWMRSLTALRARDDVDTVIVGGGDGSISSAGTVFVDSGKAMGVIPLGTFNLFARSLRIPIGFEAFLGALPDFRLEAIDTGCLTDRSGREHVFLHHVSLGMHPQFIEVREAMPYGSRVGKMLASMRVWGQTVRSLKQIPLSLGGDHVRPKARYYQAAVTVGSFREGFGDFPHAEDLTLGDLDVVLLPARGRWDFVMAMVLAALGRWRSNSRLEVESVRRLVIDSHRPILKVSIDGELERLPPPFTFRVKPKSLLVLRG